MRKFIHIIQKEFPQNVPEPTGRICIESHDLHRTSGFQYHGAEHKSIFVFENGLPLVPENSLRFTTFHPRCGTSFLLLVMLTSIVVFTFLGKPDTIGERLIRLAFVPMIGGIAYELIKLSVKPRFEKWMQPIIQPGLWLQRITTKEPTLEQVEVAMEAAKACLA